MNDNAQKILQALEEVTQTLKATTLESVNEADIVTLGATFKAIENETKRSMDLLKAHMRALAQIKDGGKPGTYQFKGRNGTSCLVVVQEPRPKLKNSATATENAAALPTFFKVSYRPVRDFMARAETTDDITRGKLAAAIDIVTDSPRVSFKS